MKSPSGKNIGLSALNTISVYRTPEFQQIPRGAQTAALYRAENDRNEAIRGAAAEWAKLCDKEAVCGPAFWRRAVPQALFDTLLGWEPAGAIVAAEAFLKHHGWTVERPQPADANINTDDIPEVGEEFFKNAKLKLPANDPIRKGLRAAYNVLHGMGMRADDPAWQSLMAAMRETGDLPIQRP